MECMYSVQIYMYVLKFIDKPLTRRIERNLIKLPQDMTWLHGNVGIPRSSRQIN